MRFSDAERADIAELFRAKLASLRAEERRQPYRRHTPSKPRPRRFRVPDDPPADDALLTTSELAALVGVSRRTVAKWAMPCRFTLGGHRRYRWADVEAWIKRSAR